MSGIELRHAAVCFVVTVWLTNASASANPLERTLIGAIDTWDANHPSYNLLGGWMTLKRAGDKAQDVGAAKSTEDFLERVSRFLATHRVEMQFPSAKLLGEERSSKLKRFLIPFVVLMVLKKSIEIPIVLGVLSLLAFKGLGAGLISLMLSSATALKSLLEHHSSSKVSYEVVPQLNHWSRSGDIDYPNLDRSGDAESFNYKTIPNPGA